MIELQVLAHAADNPEPYQGQYGKDQRDIGNIVMGFDPITPQTGADHLVGMQ